MFNFVRFLKNRLDLNCSYVEFLLLFQDELNNYVSIHNEEQIRIDITKTLNSNYADADLYDLKNKLEILFIFKDYIQQKRSLEQLSEQQLVEKLISLESYLLTQENNIDSQVLNLSSIASKDLGLMEIGFREVRKDYQRLFVFKHLKRDILNQLKLLNSPLAQLAYIFSDF